jgi:hypothetical protein
MDVSRALGTVTSIGLQMGLPQNLSLRRSLPLMFGFYPERCGFGRLQIRLALWSNLQSFTIGKGERMSEERFFIGWESGGGIGNDRAAKKIAWLVFVVGLLLAGFMGLFQRTAGSGQFAFGDVQTYEGLLVAQPLPFLLTEKRTEGHSVFLLVNPLKEGFPYSLSASNHLQSVSLEGTLIHDDLNGMIEVQPGSLRTLAKDLPMSVSTSSGVSVTLSGEIVDSKCHLGVMNPGRFKPHRACAIQCIAGGIPPILVAESREGAVGHYLLVGPNGEPIHEKLLDYVAEPISLSGLHKTVASLNILYVEMESLTRL